MSENVFVGADSFRRLLLGAAGGYELQGHHEAAETVLHVIDACLLYTSDAADD